MFLPNEELHIYKLLKKLKYIQNISINIIKKKKIINYIINI